MMTEDNLYLTMLGTGHATGFYEHMGFAVYKRTETDVQGGPYPLLYMCRK